jgi:L-aspartate oxidase
MTHEFESSLWSPVRTWQDIQDFDVTVIGGGIAGLAFILRLPEHLSVALVTKGVLGESNTRYAQGGLAAAVGPQDNPDLHFADTIASGAGLCDHDAVRTLVEGGPEAVRWLLEQGTRFDEEDDHLALGLEAAHSRNRVLHAGGDATGAEIERSLVHQLIARPQVTLFERATAIDLVREPDETGPVTGSIVLLSGATALTLIRSRLTVLANGGAGQLWAVSSNPLGATGDGIAMALRAGVDVADLEFTQFHPTVFTAPGAEPFLMTEAIRGEGAWLRAADGSRFMPDLHPLAELAPRDVVARAVQRQMQLDEAPNVWLDLRHLDPDRVRQRFPTIADHLERFGIDLTRDQIPVAPAAHYFIGGIVAGSDGATSVPGLLAIGEVSCTGVHGANRLASNSLLEGLVFGLRAADRIAETGLVSRAEPAPIPNATQSQVQGTIDSAVIRTRIQRVMSDNVAVVRSLETLGDALDTLSDLATTEIGYDSVDRIELRNMLVLAVEIVRSALYREESRGAHYRLDHPVTDSELDGKHQIVRHASQATERTLTSLPASIPAPVIC